MKLIKAFVFILSLLSFPVLAAQVDINRADAKTLERELVGIGPKTAQAIVDYRTKHGPFKSAEDLLKVKGVGKKTLEKNRDRIVVGTPGK
jgi:competence protein ComEA